MSVKCILQGQNDKSPKLYFNKILPDKPAAPIAADEEIPYSWDELNAIALSGKAADYVSVGAIKSVTLTSAVLGTTTHDIRVIGINQDNDQSITFQTKNCLVDTTSFGSSAQWIGSTARTECQNYYNAFPGKAAIKTVKKGTCLSTNDFRNGDVTYNDETVWLLSEREMNLNENSPLSVANSSNTKAECTQGKNFAYNYYSNNNSRIKTLGDNGNVKQYWERSRHYESDHMKYVCNINTDGDANPDFIGTYSTYFGLAPAFVIGNEEALSKSTLIQDGEDVTEKVKEIVKPTIEEIGAAAATHAAQHAAGGSDPITPESIGAAVSGGGVMEKAVQIVVTSADETYDSFCQKVDAILKTMPESSAKFVMAYPPGWYGNGTDMAVLYKVSNEYASLRSIGSYNLVKPGGFMMIKRKHDSSDAAGQWDPLEYIDPPLTPGVEYRTTERYQGKPVYTKLISFGLLPNNAYKDVAHNCQNLHFLVLVGGDSNGDNLIDNPYIDYILIGSTNIRIKTNADRSATSARVVIKYTKTTD